MATELQFSIVPFSGIRPVTNYNSIVEFCGNLQTTFDYLKGIVSRNPELNKKKLNAARSIIKPINQGAGTQLNINGDFQNYGTFNLTVTKEEAVKIDRSIKRELDALDAETVTVADDVTLHLYQARNDASKVGDRAVVPDFYEKPVKVIFANEAMKRKMLLDNGNPFLLDFKVDVVVDLKGKRPTCYRVVKLHSTLNR